MRLMRWLRGVVAGGEVDVHSYRVKKESGE